TAPRYKVPNKNETTAICAIAVIGGGAVTSNGRFRTTTLAAKPAIAEATGYFHTALIMLPKGSLIGLPAYQSAGRVRIQNDIVQATATPTNPHFKPSRKSIAVEQNTTTHQRIHRSALPIET